MMPSTNYFKFFLICSHTVALCRVKESSYKDTVFTELYVDEKNRDAGSHRYKTYAKFICMKIKWHKYSRIYHVPSKRVCAKKYDR